eukprot:PhF_6_TR36320/c0_g1_i2/m.53130
MGFIECIQLLATHLQFLSLLNHLTIPWPSQWRSILSWVEVFNLDFNDLLVQHDFPTFDFRGIFLVIAILVPIALVVLVLVIFNPFYTIVWYASIVIGFIILIVGLVGYYLPSATGLTSEQNVAMTYITIGAIITGLCVVLALIRMAMKQEESAREAKEEALRCKVMRSLKHFGFGMFCLIAGGIITGTFNVQVPGLDMGELSTQGNVIRVLGSVLLALGVAGLTYFLINVTECGRRATYNVSEFFRKHMLKLLLILISLSYIPTISYGINMFMCVEYTCPAGTKFNPFVQRAVGDFSTNSSLFCDPCVMSKVNNPCIYDQALLCPAFSDRRLVKYPSISCSGESHPYFIVAAALSAVVYLIGVPMLYSATVRLCTNSINHYTHVVLPEGQTTDTITADELWLAKVYTSDAAPSSLYRPYRYDARYFSLVQMIHKTSVVVMLIIVSPFRSEIAIVLTLVIHGIGSVYLIRYTPFLNAYEGGFATGLAVASVLNSIYGVYVWQVGAEGIPEYTTALFIALNGVVPIVGLAIVQVFVQFTTAREQEKRKEEIEKKAEETKKRLKEMKADMSASPDRPEGGGAPYGTAIEMGDAARDAEVAEQARAKLEEIEKNNEFVDTDINNKVSKIMTKYFMVMGVVLFIALGFTILGSLRTPIDEFINASFGEAEIKKEWGGHPSWQSFTASCCCIPNTKTIPNFNMTERWICLQPNTTIPRLGKTVSRGRISSDWKDNGLGIRGPCQQVFSSTCSIAVDKPVVRCNPRPKGTSTTAETKLW